MNFSNPKIRCGAIFLMLLAMSFPVLAVKVYYDNADTNWETPHIYYWSGGDSKSWPGQPMTLKSGTIWQYDITDGSTDVIFNNGSGSGTVQTSDLIVADEHVYTHSGDTGMTYADYVSENPDPDPDPDPVPGETDSYTIHFHNNVSWDNVYVRVTGISSVINMPMASFLNSSIYDVTFEVPAGSTPYCQFYTSVNSQEQNLTSTFKVEDGHVYTISGDKGLNSEYDPTTAVREAEFWIEPENPTQLQEVTLYFNRAFTEGSALKNTDDIYLYIGLIKKGDSDKEWSYASPYTWGAPTEKYKMTKVDPDGDLYSFSFTPSIAEWFGADPDERFSKIALIFRNQDGTIKQHGEADQFIQLRQIADAADGLGAYVSHETADDKVCVTAERGTIEITPMSADIIKVFTLKTGATKREERPSISVVGDWLEKPSFTTSLESDELIIDVKEGVKVHVDRSTCQLSFHDSDDNLYLRELSGLVNSTGNVKVSFEQMNDEAFYGGGYNGNLVNWDGSAMVMNNNQDGGWGQGSSTTRNICVPFYVSTLGYGVYFDDHYRNAKIYPSRIGSSYESGSKDPIAYYFIGGGIMDGGRGSMETVMQNYTHLTGHQELPPFWSLGYITSKFSFADRDEAEKAVSNTQDIDIPIDGIVFDIHWQTDNSLRGHGTEGMGRIDWSDAYENPIEMMKGFRDKNVHTIAITEPYFTTNSGNYDTLLGNGWLADDHVNYMEWLHSTHVGLLDITNQGAIDWYKDLYKKRTSEGIESWWLDLGEPEKHDSDSHYSDGSTVDQMNNEYGNRWTQLAYEAMKEQTPDTRFILMPRAGTSGMQRFNTFPWTGDIARSSEGLRAQVPALVSAAMSGISYLGSDIGGFTADRVGTNASLYRRWVQLGVFYPSMRTHSATEPEVWRDAYKSVRDDVRDAINLRYAYLPYTYSQSYAYTRFGTPMARPANFNDRDYPGKLANCIDAYLWGPDIYVAPVLDDYSTSRSITFPEGDWLDMTDFKTVYSGHQTVNYHAPANVLPRFMRRGSFVTRYRQDTFTNTAEIRTDRITVDYFPTKSETRDGSVLFDDDHQSVNSIADGKYVVTKFSGKGADNSILIYIDREGEGWDGMYTTQDVLIRIHAADMTGVDLEHIGFYDQQTQKRNGSMRAEAETPWAYSTIEKATSLADVTSDTRTTNAVYVDPESRTAYVRLPQLNPLEHYNVEAGEPGILTGIKTPAALGAMTLAYGDGYFTYSAPEGTEDLTIDVFGATGTHALSIGGLTADGYAAQTAVSLPAGIYIGRLSGRNSAGETRSKTVKMIVR